MTIADEPSSGGAGDGAGADGPPPSPPDDVMDDAVSSDRVVEAELLDDGRPEGSVVDPLEAEATDVAEADPLEVAQVERDEYLDSLRRLQAEFENYKKRVLKQQAEQMTRAAASLVDKLLPVLDALDLATGHVGDTESDEAKALVAASGLLQGILAKEGLERISPQGEEFDPNAHEAVGQAPAPEGVEPTASGEPRVAQVMRAGYRWHGTVVRPAMVMVEG
jgi:molecular chaperone GrpE